MKAKEHTRQVRDNVVEKFKAELGYKKNITSFEPLTEHFSIDYLKMERAWHNCKLTKTWQSSLTDRQGNESINQGSSQEAHGNSGGAAEIHSSGGRICPQDNY